MERRIAVVKRRGQELWQGGEEENRDKKERSREGEKESYEKEEERRRAVAWRRTSCTSA